MTTTTTENEDIIIDFVSINISITLLLLLILWLLLAGYCRSFLGHPGFNLASIDREMTWVARMADATHRAPRGGASSQAGSIAGSRQGIPGSVPKEYRHLSDVHD